MEKNVGLRVGKDAIAWLKDRGIEPHKHKVVFSAGRTVCEGLLKKMNIERPTSNDESKNQY